METGLANKVVVITASSKGLGKATAIRYAMEGANVVISSSNRKNLEKAAGDIQKESGKKVDSVVCDLSQKEDIINLMNYTVSTFGTVDVLVNNTGGPPPGGFDDVDDEKWQYAFEIVLLSMVRCIREVLPYMKKQKNGRIVNIASSSFKQPIDKLILSNSFRTGILGLSKSIATELAPYNILINTVGPGRIETERVSSLDSETARSLGITKNEAKNKAISMIPVGRYGHPDELASVVLFLGSFANTFATGQSILVDGGMVKSI